MAGVGAVQRERLRETSRRDIRQDQSGTISVQITVPSARLGFERVASPAGAAAGAGPRTGAAAATAGAGGGAGRAGSGVDAGAGSGRAGGTASAGARGDAPDTAFEAGPGAGAAAMAGAGWQRPFPTHLSNA